MRYGLESFGREGDERASMRMMTASRSALPGSGW